ncbi:MAG: hypothetical protein ABI333_30910 [bacterium]
MMIRLAFPGVLALGLLLNTAACGPQGVVRSNPQVKFVAPAGVYMFLKQDGGVIRVRFGNKLRLSPVGCDATAAILHTAESSPSLRHTLMMMSRRDGYGKVQLHEPGGKILGRGSLCVFPTLKTPTKSILHHYTIEIPASVLRRLKSGKQAALFETYRPEGEAKPGWNHIAWVLYLHPYP